ncbi:MAG: lmo0937 family membrane protein [Thermomicrobiales bacterium]
MLWALIAILLVFWLLGFTVVNLGAFIHLLLVIALIVLIVQLLTGRRGGTTV